MTKFFESDSWCCVSVSISVLEISLILIVLKGGVI